MTWATERLDLLQSGEATPPPVTETLRMGLLDDWGPGWARKVWLPQPELMNGDGSMFGGYIAALADQMLCFAAMTVIPDDNAMRTLNLNVQFFRVGRAHPLTIEGRVTAQTRQLISVEADFRRDDGELIARAAAQQILTPFPR